MTGSPSSSMLPRGVNHWTVGLLALAVLLGAFFRTWNISEIGFAEDEVNKIDTVREYQQGQFTGNAEHPMLMKGLILVSVSAADVYNDRVAAPLGWHPMPEEMSVRLPNIVAGALTAVALFLVGAAFFNPGVGLLAAFFWALGLNAIVINRIAKEDTLMVFFILLGFYFHQRMKTTPEMETGRKKLFYLLSAASFGAMLASKYFPHYLGLTALYFLLHRKLQPGDYPADAYGRRELCQYFLVLGAVFLLLNPMILSPTVLHYIFSYTGQKTVTHHGYQMFGHIFPNSVTATPFGGTPWYFYLLFLLVKVPPVLLGLFAVGVAASCRRWRAPGPFLVLFWLVFWLVPYSVCGVKFLRYTLSLLPALYLGAAYGAWTLWEWLSSRMRRPASESTRRWLAVGASAAVMVVLAGALVRTNPYFSLYVSPLAGGESRAGYFFPHDEYYDLRLRETIREVLTQAPPSSAVAGETPAAFRYYLRRFGRTDVRVLNLSGRQFPLRNGQKIFIFLQPGRKYFENREFHARLWHAEQPVVESVIARNPAIRVFSLSDQDFLGIACTRTCYPDIPFTPGKGSPGLILINR